MGKTVLGKKVVDTARKKVARVNDVELAESEGALQVVGVEGGLRGLLRHLRSEPLAERLAAMFGKSLPHDVVPWEVIDPIETELSRARRQAVYTKLAKLHPADIADIMEELNPGERAAVLAALDEVHRGRGHHRGRVVMDLVVNTHLPPAQLVRAGAAIKG